MKKERERDSWGRFCKEHIPKNKNSTTDDPRVQDSVEKGGQNNQLLKREHWNKGRKRSDETKAKMSKAMLGRSWESHMSPEALKENKLKASEVFKQMWADPIFRAKTSKNSKENWTDPIYRDKVVGGLKKQWADPIRKAKRSEQAKEIWADPIRRAKRGERSKELWADPIYRDKVVGATLSARWNGPNRKEKILLDILDSLFPGEYGFVGAGSLVIGGKCPDFANINGKNKLIELFGTYWHKPEEEAERVNHFAQYNFSTLVVWETELADKKALTEKLLAFHNMLSV